jgi:hypothetical protein
MVVQLEVRGEWRGERVRGDDVRGPPEREAGGGQGHAVGQLPARQPGNSLVHASLADFSFERL